MDEPKLSAMFEQGVGEVRARAAESHNRAPLTLGRLCDLISLAISYGVTLYNEGRHDLCYKLYAEVAVQVMAGPGAEGAAPVVAEGCADLERALLDSRQMDPSDAAWCMRHAFDKTMLNYQIEDRRVQLLVEQGQAAFARTDYGGAASAYQAATARFDEIVGPDPVEATPAWRLSFLLLGHTHFAQGRYDEAAARIRHGMRLVPEWTRSKIRIQDQYLHKERLQDQLEALGAHLTQHPDDAEARFLYGYVHFFTDEKATASRILRHHLQLHPDDAEAQELVGASLLSMA